MSSGFQPILQNEIQILNGLELLSGKGNALKIDVNVIQAILKEKECYKVHLRMNLPW